MNRNRQATIGEALNLGEVLTYREIAFIIVFPFAVMFTVMGFTHSNVMGLMGIIGLPVCTLLAIAGGRMIYKRCKDAL